MASNAFANENIGLFMQQLLQLLPLIQTNPDAVAQLAAEKAAPPQVPEGPQGGSAVGAALTQAPKGGAPKGVMTEKPGPQFPDLGAIGRGLAVPQAPQVTPIQPRALPAPQVNASGATNPATIQLLQTLLAPQNPQFRSLGDILGGVR